MKKTASGYLNMTFKGLKSTSPQNLYSKKTEKYLKIHPSCVMSLRVVIPTATTHVMAKETEN